MSGKISILFIIFVLLNIRNLTKCEIVEIEDGKIEGTTMKTRKGFTIQAFLKIPFAEPPVGELRFQQPVKNKRWEGIMNATIFGPACMQDNIKKIKSEMSEDCLHLNVFTRNLKPKKVKPVIVYIHGGGYVSGSAIRYYPYYLLDRDVVLVTINYRLGPFGFLATGTKEVPGNMGLKDQVLALKWIQRNIANFGGDPNLVTISGLSAGGFSVTAHMGSEMSKGLFHRAIALSGAITWQIGLDYNNVNLVKEVAESLGCSTAMSDMISCLKKKDAWDIIQAGSRFYYGCLVMPWLPVVEKQFGQDRFFSEQPNKVFKDEKFNKVPIIIGITADEFIGPVNSILNNNESLALLNENFSEFASKCFFFKENGAKTTDEIATIFRKFYLPFEKIDSRSFNSLHHLCADGTIGYGVHKFVHSVCSFTDVYYYKFTFIGRFSGFNYPRDKPYGVHHGDDNQYIILGDGSPKINEFDPENFMVERMTRIWEHFAVHGDPNNPFDGYLVDMHWPKITLENEYFLDIGENMVEKQGLYLERYKVWDSLKESSLMSDEDEEFCPQKGQELLHSNLI